MALFLLPGAPAPADSAGEGRAPTACGISYTVAPGDSLYEIAKRFYRDGPRYGAIFEANRETLDRATFIDVGEVLHIPCLGGADRSAAELAEIARRLAAPTGSVDPAMPVPRPDEPEYGLAIASVILPASRIEPLSGGVLTDLMLSALAASGRAEAFHLGFVDDRARHLDRLLSGGGYTLSFPWYRPDCDAATGDGAAGLCRDYDFSRPFLEVTLSYFAAAGSPLAAGAARLAGKAVCKPVGYLPHDLPEPELATGSVPVRARSAVECLRLLARGEVDAVRLVQADGAREIDRMGLGGQLIELAALRRSHTLHAVARKADPRGKSALAILDDGLDRLMRSGDWFAVVSAHAPREADRWARR